MVYGPSSICGLSSEAMARPRMTKSAGEDKFPMGKQARGLKTLDWERQHFKHLVARFRLLEASVSTFD